MLAAALHLSLLEVWLTGSIVQHVGGFGAGRTEMLLLRSSNVILPVYTYKPM
jgi:hypothetical protein